MTIDVINWVQIEYKDRFGDRMTIVSYVRNKQDIHDLIGDLSGEYITHREWVQPVERAYKCVEWWERTGEVEMI